MRLFATDSGPAWVRVLRWLARTASGASLALMALMATEGPAMPRGSDWLLVGFFPIGVALGLLIAWRNEILGGAIAGVSLAAFYVVNMLDSSRLPAGPWFLVFASPALALLGCGLVARRKPG